MLYLDLSYDDPASNLACDEALLECSEESPSRGILRFWESPVHFVVLGRSNSARSEVNVDACHRLKIPVLRRCSGGGTVLQGPGCLNYSLILDTQKVSDIGSISSTNTTILKYHKKALEPMLGNEIHRSGDTDLTIRQLKVSGNAQRRLRRFVLFHGTFLLHLDLKLMETVLNFPSRQPDYRDHRSHSEFVRQLPLSRESIKSALIRQWGARGRLKQVPECRVRKLVEERYSRPDWNLKL